MPRENELSKDDLASKESIIRWTHIDRKINVSCKWTIQNFQMPSRTPIVSRLFTAGHNKELKWRLQLDPLVDNNELRFRIKFQDIGDVKCFFKLTILKHSLQEEENKRYDDDLYDLTNPNIFIKISRFPTRLVNFLQDDGSLTIVLRILAVEPPLVEEQNIFSWRKPQQHSKPPHQLPVAPTDAPSSTDSKDVKKNLPSEPLSDSPVSIISSPEPPLSLESLLDSGLFSDVRLIVEGKELRAHRNILAARSPIFLSMFSDKDSTVPGANLEFRDVDYLAMRAFLRYLYSGRYGDHADDLAFTQKLLRVAEKFAVDELVARCEDQLIGGTSPENAIEMLILAQDCSAQRLKTQAVTVLTEHLPRLDGPGLRSLGRINADLVVDLLLAVADKSKGIDLGTDELSESAQQRNKANNDTSTKNANRNSGNRNNSGSANNRRRASISSNNSDRSA